MYGFLKLSPDDREFAEKVIGSGELLFDEE